MNPFIERLVNDKVDAAFKQAQIPKKFFVTENGRGVVDGGDLYNAVVADVVSIMKVAIGEILSEMVSASQPAPQQSAPKQAAPQSTAKSSKTNIKK